MNRRNRSLGWSQLAALTLLVTASLSARATAQTGAARTGGRAPWATSNIKGTPEPPAPYKIRRVFANVHFQRPTCLLEVPGESRMLVTQIDGKLFTFPKDEATSQVVQCGDLRQLAGGDVSLFSAALHPQFTDNRLLFVCYVHPGDGRHTRVSRFSVTPGMKLAPASEQVVIRWPAGGHNAGCLHFGKDGMLYISTGDGSGPNPPDGLTTGQDVSDLLGSILRINVDSTADKRPYTIPADNPFVGRADTREEIWAYGLRNPWKFGVDNQTGEIFAADNGWESWEMIHRITRGGNCGWPVMEGRASLRSEVAVGPTAIQPPVKDHPHSEANSVIGGPVYRGGKLAELDGYFVYGDYITGTIWAVNAAGENRTLVDTDQRIVAFAEGREGELFVLDYDFTGAIYELLPSRLPDTSADFPRRLSATGLFQSLESLKPAAGVVPYEVVAEQWADGAAAQRWIAIPDDGQAILARGGEPSTFPEGTVLVKHLSLPRSGRDALRLETQLLHFEQGSWHPYSYLWDSDGSDAELVGSAGADRPLTAAETGAEGPLAARTWHVSAHNECRLCHNAGSHFVLGFVPNQLDRAAPESPESTEPHDQLSRLAALGVAHGVSGSEVAARSRLVDPHDEASPLDDRARSYLHANCSMCHHPGGNAIVSFFLRRELPFEDLRTFKGTGIGTFGMRNAKLIVPGDPYRSVLMYRMSKLGYGRMPYIGSRVVDGAGVALIEEWIRRMPANESPEMSPLLTRSKERTAMDLLNRGDSDRPQRDEAIELLASSTEGALALIGRLHAGALGADDLKQAVAAGGKAAGDRRGLFETFIPESQRRPTLGPNFEPAKVLGLEGSLSRGKLIYFSDNARCRACHDPADAAKSLGPTLAEINKKYPLRSEFLQHVRLPSLKIEDKYATYSVLTSDGEVVNGLLHGQDAASVVIQTAERKQRRIPRAEISRMQKGAKSLMPERLLSDLTAQEAADLLAYIRSLGAN